MSRIAVIIKSGQCQKNYEVFGNSEVGFGLKIIWRETDRDTSAKTPLFFVSRKQSLGFLHQLMKADVHPVHLMDVTRDYLLEQSGKYPPSFSD